MKKTIALITTVVIWALSLQVSYAETFSVRNGITFGMSQEQVNQIEVGKNGNSTKSGSRFYYKVDSIAGIKCEGNDDNITYYFTDNELTDIKYFTGYHRSGLLRNSYNDVKQSMKQKYGTPLHENDGKLFEIQTESGNGFAYQQVFNGAKMNAYCQWLKRFDDIYVLMDVIYYTNKSGDAITIGYKRITQLEMDKLNQQNNSTQQQRNNDL